MAYIKNRFSRLFFGMFAEILIIIAGIIIAFNIKDNFPLWVAFILIFMGVILKIFIKNDLE